MFSFFRNKRKNILTDFSAIGADMHSHLLPGIDDGSPDAETSIFLIKGLRDLGFQRLITTPHILWDLYRNDDNTIKEATGVLAPAMKEASVSIPLTAAAEYMIDDHFINLLKNKQPLRCLFEKYVLVEFSFVALPFEWKQVFFDLQILGYQPVLAHPERYSFLSNRPAIFREIADMGVLLQVNLNSLTGYYGKAAFHLAQYLINHKLVSFLGSDLHHQRHLDALRKSTILMDQLQTILNSGKLLNPSISLVAD